MTRKEAIVHLIKGENPGYTPHHFDLTLKMTDRLAEYYGYDRDGVEDYIGNHLLYLDPETGFRNSVKGNFVDEFGTTWDTAGNYDIGDWGMVAFPIEDFDFSNYTFPDGKSEGRYVTAIKVMEKYKDRFNVMRITGPLNLGWYTMGFSEFLIGMLVEKETIHMVFDKVTEYICNLIDRIPAGVDAVRMIEDWGIQSGLMFSKELWMEYLYPSYKQIYQKIRSKGLYVMQHSCGDITDLMPVMVELGVDVIDAMQPEAMDIAQIKKDFGRDIVLFGGLGSQSTIPRGIPADVIAEAVSTLKIMSEGGKYIFGPAGSIPTEAPIENVIALVDFCKSLKEKGI